MTQKPKRTLADSLLMPDGDGIEFDFERAEIN